MPDIKRVIYSNPVTVIVWEDGTKTRSRCDESDVYDELTGFMLCVFKKALNPKAMRKMFNDYVYDIDSNKIKWNSSPTWLKEEEKDVVHGTMDDKAIIEDMKDFLSWLLEDNKAYEKIWGEYVF